MLTAKVNCITGEITFPDENIFVTRFRRMFPPKYINLRIYFQNMLNIDELIKESLKNKKTSELKVYRNLKADIMAFKTQKNAPTYDEAAELKIIQKYVTKMEDAEKQYSQAGREDLASECRDELEVLRKLLPEPVTASEIYEELRYWAEKNHYLNEEIASEIKIPKKEMGTVIKYIKSQLPTADGKMISEIVKENLE